MIKQYETVFIATPVLSEAQMKEAVKKYVDYIVAKGGEIVYEEDWGLRQLAYPILMHFGSLRNFCFILFKQFIFLHSKTE